MICTFIDQRFYYVGNDGHGTYPMDSFQNITQNMFYNLFKILHLADLEIYFFNLELAIELY